MPRGRWLYVAVLALVVNACGAAQDDSYRHEVGAQFTALNFKSLYEKPAGVGGRFSYNLNRYLAVESEANYFPQNPDGDFGQTQFVAGIRAGYQFGGLAMYGKMRPGFVRFGGAAYRVYNGDNPTRPALDIGAVMQYFPHEGHVGARIDWGDTLISMPARFVQTGSATASSGGWKHNPQGEIGIVVRF